MLKTLPYRLLSVTPPGSRDLQPAWKRPEKTWDDSLSMPPILVPSMPTAVMSIRTQGVCGVKILEYQKKKAKRDSRTNVETVTILGFPMKWHHSLPLGYFWSSRLGPPILHSRSSITGVLLGAAPSPEDTIEYKPALPTKPKYSRTNIPLLLCCNGDKGFLSNKQHRLNLLSLCSFYFIFYFLPPENSLPPK